jgi:hypothetical protein
MKVNSFTAMRKANDLPPINTPMRLFEILARAGTYYLGSHIPLSGEVTRHDLRTDVHPRHHGIEAILERARPPDCISRADCIFLADSRAGVAALGMPTSRVYAAQPIGDVQRSDVGWWRMLHEALARGEQERAEGIMDWATQYWYGTECPTGSPIWEYRARAVRIE